MLIDCEPVTLNKFQLNTIERLYDSALAEETIVEKITYFSDGLKVKGFIARPSLSGQFPVLIWNRGGWRESGGLDSLTAHLILASTARWGYVVLATQYRGNFGGEGEEDWGDRDVNDAFNLIELTNELAYCDSSRISVEGASRGGITTYKLLTMYDQFKCAIVHAGISNVHELVAIDNHFAEFTSRRWGDLPDEVRLSEMTKRSATLFADKLSMNTPILLLHGTNDNIVPLSQSELMVTRLTELNHQHEFVPIKGGGHIALKDGSYLRIDTYRKGWLGRWA